MKRIHGYCTILALTYCSGLPESQVLDICKWHGFKDNGKGMDDPDWQDAADDLGIRRRAVRLSQHNVGQFLKAHPNGLYLVTTYNHIFTVLNGGIVSHPLQDPLGRRCKVEAAWRVLK
jgi:hypothetical protein